MQPPILIQPGDHQRFPGGVARSAGAVLGALVTMIAMGVLLSGAIRGYPSASAGPPSFAFMKPQAALSLVGSGAGLLVLILGSRSLWKRAVGMSLSASATIIGLITLVEHATDGALGLDVILSGVLGYETGSRPGGRPALATGTALSLSGISIFLLPLRKGWCARLGHIGAIGTAVIGAIALLGYVYDVRQLYHLAPFTSVSLPTAGSFVFLAIGMTLARPTQGLAGLLLRQDAGGVVARQLLPIGIGAPIIFGLGVNLLESRELVEYRLAMAILVVALMLVGSFSIGLTAARLSQSDQHRRDAERRVRSMLAELDHRVKNTMAAVLSVCEQTAVGSSSIDEFRQSYRGRLQAMARAHEALAATRWKGAPLKQIVTTILNAYAHTGERHLEIKGNELMLPGSAALPLAVTLNELATNAIKHGAWSNPSTMGHVTVSWTVEDDDLLRLEWTERGATATPAPTHRNGFGLSLIKGMVPHELGGDVVLGFEPGGARCRIGLSLREARIKTEERFSSIG